MTEGVRPVILIGLPDDGRVEVVLDAQSKIPVPRFEGTASFLGQLLQQPPLASGHRLYIGPGLHPRVRRGGTPTQVINHVADADRCRVSLDIVDSLVRTWNATCFNPAAAVRATTRDASSKRLAGIPGVTMPRTIRLQPRRTREVFEAASAAGIGFPCLARIAGDHGGTSLVRLEHDADEESLNRIPWGGRTLYLTQFVDFADADGRYRKLRLAVVGQQFFPRHLVVGNRWLLHAERRDPAAAEDERKFFESFDDVVRPRLEAPVREIIRRVGLDYHGIDCSIRPDGQLLLFEVNACMNILHNSRPSPNLWDAPIAAISTALLEHLSEPSRWAGQPSAATADAPQPA